MLALYFVVLIANCLLVQSRDYKYYDLKEAEDHFEQFIEDYNKQYSSKHEKQVRFEIFSANLKGINKKNQESDQAVYGITQFSDMTEAEFLSQYTGYINANVTADGCDENVNLKDAPDSFDWRTKNVVSRVKNQDICGSCWAFSCTGAVESGYAIKYNKIQEVSEQQLVDCDKKSMGCSGTDDLAKPFKYLVENGAISEQDYPYIAREDDCKFDANKVRVKLTGCRNPSINNDEEKLKRLLHQYGPTTIAVAAEILHNYHNGIIKEPHCKVGRINHAVLLVGYGTENGVPYWIIKNSWSERFGEKGYFRVQRGINCMSLATVDPVLPIVA